MSVRGSLSAPAQSGVFPLRTGTALERRSTSLRARAGQLSLAGVLACGLVLTLAATNTDSLLPESARPIPAWLAGPFAHASFRLATVPLLLVLSAMFASYLVAVRHAGWLSARSVLMVIAGLHALVLLAPPLLSTDVFSYQAYARMGAVYGANPYLHGPQAIALDPVYPFIGAKWVATPTAYGPLFTLLSYAFATLSIALSVVAYKAIAAVASLTIVALVWNAARLRGLDPVRAACLVGLNPLFVLYGVGGGHNDLLMLALIAAGVYLALAQRERGVGAAFVLAAGVKLTAGLYGAFALAGTGGPGAAERRRGVLVGAVATLVAGTAITAAVFGGGPLHMIANIIQGQSKGDWHSVSGFITTKLGLATAGRVVGIGLGVVCLGTIAWLLRRVWQGRLDWIDGAGWATAALLVCASALFPWYVAWLLPFAALAADRRLVWVALGLTGVVQAVQMLGYIPHGL